MTTNQSRLASLLLCLLIHHVGTTHAAELFSDSFTYSDGPLVGATDSLWQAHSQGGNGPVAITDGAMVLRFDLFEDINASLAGGPYLVDGPVSVLYGQFTVQVSELPSEAGAYFAHFRSGNAHRARVWISTLNADEGQFRLGIGNSSGADATSGEFPMDLQTNQTYRVVFRYEIDSGLSAIGIDPQVESDLTTVASDPVGLSSVSSIAFRQSAGIGILRIDDLLVTDVFPGSESSAVRLAIEQAEDGIVVKWPIQVTNVVLRSASRVDAPSWELEEGSIILDALWHRYAVPNASGHRFYRLTPP